MRFDRKTVRGEVRWEGKGLHSGVPVQVTVRPGDRGIWFRLGAHEVQAVAENVTDTTRCTRLGEISTIEHLMSAFAGLEVTDAEVEVTAPELPGLDGSSLPYVVELLGAGLQSIGQFEATGPFTRVFVHREDIKVAVASGEGHWRFEYNTGDRWPHQQAFEMIDVVSGYAAEVAPARTFALAEEIPMIIQSGLGQGLDEESALILGIEGYKNDPRLPDEPARHKLLDLMGDLYLSGVPVRALSVVAERSGHRVNVEAAKLIRLATMQTAG